ncbi:MAG: N-acetyltransferase [Gammaproteobacteria bacterium]|nr:N-acetyltransferase [Gammaproteobacteria bacterium]
MQPVIAEATEADLPGLLAIYNEVLSNSTAVFSSTAMTLPERRDWWRVRVAQGYPVLTARVEGEVLGFATFGDFRAGPGYRFTVEHTVHVHHRARGRGIGGQLVRALLVRGAALGKHVMVAGVDAANAASIRFHERLGFERVGQLHEVGFKFDRWLDLVFLQRRI